MQNLFAVHSALKVELESLPPARQLIHLMIAAYWPDVSYSNLSAKDPLKDQIYEGAKQLVAIFQDRFSHRLDEFHLFSFPEKLAFLRSLKLTSLDLPRHRRSKSTKP